MHISVLSKPLTKMAVAALLAVGLATPSLAQVPSYLSPPYQRPTFSAAVTGLAVPQTGAMDVACLKGSATRTIRVKRISISGTDTTGQSANATLVLRSTADTGGTSTTPTVVPLVSTNAAATGVLTAYTVAPTPGTAIGTIRTVALPLPTAATLPPQEWRFGAFMDNTQDIILTGVTQLACVNFPAAFTTAGPSLDIDFTWTEQ